MWTRPGMRQIISCLGLVLGLTAGVVVQAQTLVMPSVGSGRTGCLLFLDSWSETVLPLPVADLRRHVERQLEVAWQQSGRTVVMTEGLVAQAGRHRVRNSAALGPRFLADLRDQLGVDELITVQLIVEPGRLLMLARGLDTSTGLVRQLWQDEQPLAAVLLGDDPAAERDALMASLGHVMSGLARAGRAPDPDPGRPRTLLLPATAVGCGAQESLLATHCLLTHAVVDSRLAFVDPAYVAAVLLDAGHDPRRLDAAARRELTRTFAVASVAQPTLMAYGSGSVPTPRAIGNDPDERIGPRSQVSSFWLTLHLVDLEDGTLMAGADLYVQHHGRTGWFGVGRPHLVAVPASGRHRATLARLPRIPGGPLIMLDLRVVPLLALVAVTCLDPVGAAASAPRAGNPRPCRWPSWRYRHPDHPRPRRAALDHAPASDRRRAGGPAVGRRGAAAPDPEPADHPGGLSGSGCKRTPWSATR